MQTTTPSFKLLVFDWDGTLMDSAPRIVYGFQTAIHELGLAAREDEDIRNLIGLGLQEVLKRLYPELDEAEWLTLRERYRYHFLTATVATPLFEGAAETLHALEAAGYWLAVATGKSRAGLDRSLRETGLGKLFHTTRTAEETASKPHPHMLQDIMSELMMEPADTLMIGDTEYDLEMAVNAGTASLGVSYGVHSCERLSVYQPLACLRGIAELPEWLENRAAPAFPRS